MHEMSLCHEAVTLITEQAQQNQANKITNVWLEVSSTSCVEVGALRFCFQEACRNTMADGCTLHIIETQGQAWCFDCQQPVTIEKQLDPCPLCNGVQIRMSQQESLRIKEIEVE